MPSLSVGKIDDDTMRLLQMQAAKHGASVEEEVRQIIKRAVSTPESLGDLAVKLFSPAYGNEELTLPERETHEPLSFANTPNADKDFLKEREEVIQQGQVTFDD